MSYVARGLTHELDGRHQHIVALNDFRLQALANLLGDLTEIPPFQPPVFAADIVLLLATPGLVRRRLDLFSKCASGRGREPQISILHLIIAILKNKKDRI